MNAHLDQMCSVTKMLDGSILDLKKMLCVSILSNDKLLLEKILPLLRLSQIASSTSIKRSLCDCDKTCCSLRVSFTLALTETHLSSGFVQK